jgi:serine/threonine-protein kinase RsbW
MVVELEVPARAEFVALARMVVATVASSRRDLPADKVDDLRLAVSEACTNAIEAHRAASVDEPVLVRIWEADDHLDVCVQDHGKGFDPDTLPEHPPVTDPERLNFERGLGIPLMRSLVDDVVFRPSPSGTEVHMTIRGGRRAHPGL